MQQHRIQTRVVHALNSVFGKLPSDISEWPQAMLFEAGETRGVGEFVIWICGVFTTTFRVLVSHALLAAGAARPLAATCSAFYFGCLSSFVLVRLLIELVTSQVPLLWGSVWMSVGRCFALWLISMVVAIGIWRRRNYARHAAIGIAAAQIMATVLIIDLNQNLYVQFTKLLMDVAIIAMMSRHDVSLSFAKPCRTSKQD